MKSKLLLHICCAPCSASCVAALKDGYDISFYWFNLNIWPFEEYEKRKEAARNYAKESGFDFFEEKDYVYNYADYISSGGEICESCYELRLLKTADFAKNNAFDYFSTSLLSSPYQKHNLIKDIAERISKKSGAKFLYRDFRPGFYDGKNILRKKGYYMQKYCACNKSYKERFEIEK